MKLRVMMGLLAAALVAGCAHRPEVIAPVASLRTTQVKGAGGLVLAVHETGNPTGRPIILIHGVNQSHLSWKRQLSGDLTKKYRLIAVDLRGHGLSARPQATALYRGDRAWADDLNAVIGQLKLDRPVLVGWSYGGRVAMMYLRHYGDARLGAVVFVDTVASAKAAVRTKESDNAVLRMVKPAGYADYIAGVRRFVRLMYDRELPVAEHEEMVGYNMAVPQEVFSGIRGPFDYTSELQKLKAPALVIHGAKDRHSALPNGQYIRDNTPGSRLVVFEQSGHMPFFEEPASFDRTLDAFVSGLRQAR